MPETPLTVKFQGIYLCVIPVKFRKNVLIKLKFSENLFCIYYSRFCKRPAVLNHETNSVQKTHFDQKNAKKKNHNSDAENSRSACFDWHNYFRTGIKYEILVYTYFTLALFIKCVILTWLFKISKVVTFCKVRVLHPST